MGYEVGFGEVVRICGDGRGNAQLWWVEVGRWVEAGQEVEVVGKVVQEEEGHRVVGVEGSRRGRGIAAAERRDFRVLAELEGCSSEGREVRSVQSRGPGSS